MRRKIIIIALYPTSHAGGVSRLMYFLSKALNQQGFAVDFLNKDRFTLIEQKIYRIFEHLRLGKLAFNLILIRYQSLISRKYDLLITNSYCGSFVNHSHAIQIYHETAYGYQDSLMKHLPWRDRCGIELIAWLHKRAGKKKIRVCVSETCKKEVEQHYKLAIHKVIYNAVNNRDSLPPSLEEKKELRYSLKLPLDKPIVIFVGRMEIAKGIDILNEVVNLSKEEMFFLVCTDRVRENYRLKKENVRYETSLNLKEMTKRYQCADAFFLPSRYEGFGLAALEALSCGLPVVGFEVGVLQEVKKRKPELGKYVLSMDASAFDFQKVVKEAINNKLVLGKYAREYVDKFHRYSEFQRRWTQFIEEVISQLPLPHGRGLRRQEEIRKDEKRSIV